MRFKKFNDEVLYTDEDITKVSREDIETLKTMSLNNERKRIRLCSHNDVNDIVHEMLIIHTKDTYVRPHKHINKSESFHVIEGVCDVIIFDDDGNIKEVIEMGDLASGKCFYYRIAEPLYHTLNIKSDFLVFHEATKGPFNRDDTVFASWAPEDGDQEAVRRFMEKLQNCREVTP